MRLREGLRSNRRCDVSVLARIMEDYAFLCIYASRRNALNSAEAGVVDLRGLGLFVSEVHGGQGVAALSRAYEPL
jgi:hypothetical protein